MIERIIITNPEDIRPTCDTVLIDDKHEQEAVKDFRTPEQAKEYQQLVKILTVKNYTL